MVMRHIFSIAVTRESACSSHQPSKINNWSGNSFQKIRPWIQWKLKAGNMSNEPHTHNWQVKAKSRVYVKWASHIPARTHEQKTQHLLTHMRTCEKRKKALGHVGSPQA